MQLAEQELTRNVLTVKVYFGGGNSGCSDVVYKSAKYLNETGVN